MKKISLLPAAIVGFMGVAFALASMFPNTPFPKNPDGPGTIGGFLASYFTNGKANDTSMLSGTVASGYLQNNDCTNPVNKVWVGVDDNGKGRCGSLDSKLLGYITDYTGSSVTVKYPGDVTATPVGGVGVPIYSGAVIETGNDALATVIFSDNSAIRLNTGSVVDFQMTMSGSDTIAQMILDHGEIWGRVMTSTGMNFGNADWIAGVRGTALTMDYRNIGTESSPIMTGSITIIDSTVGATEVAAVMTSRIAAGVTTTLKAREEIAMIPKADLTGYISAAASMSVASVDGFSDEGMVETQIAATRTPVIRTTSLQSPWVRENIKKDLVHLTNVSNSGGVSLAVKTKAEAEFMASAPKSDPECTDTIVGKVVKEEKSGKHSLKSKRAKFIKETTLAPSCTAIVAAITSAVSTEEKMKRTACALESMQYVGGADPEGYCDDKGLIAVAEYDFNTSTGQTFDMVKVGGGIIAATTAHLVKTTSHENNIPLFGTNGRFLSLSSGSGGGTYAAKLAALNAYGYDLYDSGSPYQSILHEASTGRQGVYMDNNGNDDRISYTLLPGDNVNRIEVTVRGESLLRDMSGLPYFLLSVNGYYIQQFQSSGLPKLKLMSTGGVPSSIVFTTTGLGINQHEWYTVVFSRDISGIIKLGILDKDGNSIYSQTGSVGTNPIVGTLNIGYLDSISWPWNDIIDSVRIFN